MNNQHILFIHGALHGGWCWKPLVEDINKLFPNVVAHTPTLVGLAERQDELTQSVDLSCQIEDIANYIEELSVDEITIVAHSYGALIALALNERYSAIVKQVILIDGLVCEKDTAAISIWPKSQQQARIQASLNVNDVPCFNTAPALLFGIEDKEMQDYVDSKLTPHPLACYFEPMPLKSELAAQKNDIIYIECTAPTTKTAQESLKLIRTNLDWPIIQFDSGHDAMLIEPKALASLITTLMECSPLAEAI